MFYHPYNVICIVSSISVLGLFLSEVLMGSYSRSIPKLSLFDAGVFIGIACLLNCLVYASNWVLIMYRLKEI